MSVFDGKQHDRFLDSVADFSSKDLENNHRANKKPDITGLLLRCFLIALCIGIFGYSVFMIASRAVETNVNEELYSSIRPENFESEVKKAAPLPEPLDMYTLEQMMDSDGEYQDYVGEDVATADPNRRSNYFHNFKYFKNKYDNVYAWIYVDGTKIDYPVMKCDDNDYYLDHDFNGKETAAGSIFADSFMSDTYDANLNNVIYGHCMKNGSMFRTLKTFMESANRYTLAKDMNIEIYTPDGLYIYKVFSGYRSNDVFYLKGTFSSDTVFTDWLKLIKSKDTLRCGRDYSANSRVCTLITCANVSSDKSQRYVLHGILVSFIPASNL